MNNSLKYKLSFKYAISFFIGVVSFFGCIKQTFSQEFSSAFTCVTAPSVQPPPPLQSPLLPTSATFEQTLKPVCPPGKVPQPHFNKQNQLKGLPPQGGLQNPSLALAFHYVYTYKYANCLGSWSIFSQHKPFLSPLDYHTLVEIAAMSTDTKQIVEVGWTIDRGLNGDDNPHLFVFTWVNRTPNCYNGCGYVQVSPTFRPGMSVTSDGSQHVFAIEFYQGNWWINYDGQWMGYFPESVWTSKGVSYNQAGLIEWFGEVATNTGSRTQMGNGIFGSVPGSATINNTSIILSTTNSILAGWASPAGTDLSCFNYATVRGGSDFRYGGPGC